MSWESEKQVYIDKLERIVSGVREILNLQGNRIVTPEMKNSLESSKKSAEYLLPKLKNDEFEIAVVGLEKSGKSSFSNALIGLNVLPTKEGRCTYTSTCIRPGKSDSADVEFYSEAEFNRDFKEKLEMLGVPNAAMYHVDGLSLEKYEQLFESCSSEKQTLYRTTLNKDIIDIIENWESLKLYIGSPVHHFENVTLNNSELTAFITSKCKALAVKNVTIYSTELQKMPNAIMYDVPGFNSPTLMHREQTKQKMRSADAIVMVAKAHEPSITGDVLEIFKESDDEGAPLSEKLFVFANKADLSKQLEDNKAITYDEWIRIRKIIPETAKERIVFGSANAHLGDAVPDGLEAREKLKSMNMSDGIEELRQKLQTYYENDRFDVLKKRINKIVFDVERTFKDVKDEYDWNGAMINTKEYSQITLDLDGRLRAQLPDSLQNLKNKLNEDSRSDQPLTTAITSEIENLITTEQFAISDDEIDKIHMAIEGVSRAQQPQKLDSHIREERFASMYDAFCKKILECTSIRHGEVCHAILDIFMQALNVDKGCPEYEQLKDKVSALCGLKDTVADAYYKSLMERFARDLFEVQIKFALGQDRLNKFQEEATNFFSLGVFYNASINAGNDDTKLDYLADTPQESMLWKMILYPEYASDMSKNEVLDDFMKHTGLKKVNDTLRKQLNEIMNLAGPETINLLMDALIGINLSGPEAVVLSQIKERLTEKIFDLKSSPRENLKEILSGNQYQMDIAQQHSKYTYKTVQDEFALDIKALRLELKNAFVPAVNLDKAFSARESKLIEDIIGKVESVNDPEFKAFICENIELIESAKFSELKSENDRKQMDIAVMRNIQSILDKIVEVKS